jgi:ferredoxin
MIIADRKPLEEIQDMIKECDKVMLVGCKGCVTVCNAGGLKEVEILASTLRIARKKEGRPAGSGREVMLERQCDPEYIEQLRDSVDQYDAVLSMACGVGRKFLSEAYPSQRFFPTVNTKFMGGAVSSTAFGKNAAPAAVPASSICLTMDVPDRALFQKPFSTAPAAAAPDGKCEVSQEIECIWDSIVQEDGAGAPG